MVLEQFMGFLFKFRHMLTGINFAMLGFSFWQCT